MSSPHVEAPRIFAFNLRWNSIAFSSLRTIYLAILLFAFARGAWANTDTTDVVVARGSDGHRYWVTFYARPIKGKHFEHSFVGWKDQDPAGKVTEGAYGIYPAAGGKPFAAIFGPIPAALQKDDAATASVALRVEVNERQFAESKAVLDKQQSKSGTYQLLIGDCVTFAQTVAHAMHLNIADRNGAQMPTSYVREMINVETLKQTKPNFDGTSYAGQFLQDAGLPDGQGTITFSNGTATGRFEGGRLVDGVIKYSDGRVYTGALDDHNKYTGRGGIVYPNGDKFDGDFSMGLPQDGTYTSKDGSKLSGPVVLGQFKGSVRYDRSDGTHYVGDWANNRPEGKGKETTKDGTQYSGTFAGGALQKEGGKVLDTGGHVHDYGGPGHGSAGDDSAGSLGVDGKGSHNVSFPKDDVYGAGDSKGSGSD